MVQPSQRGVPAWVRVYLLVGAAAGARDRDHGTRAPGPRRGVPACDDAAQRPLRCLLLPRGRYRPSGVGRRPPGRRHAHLSRRLHGRDGAPPRRHRLVLVDLHRRWHPVSVGRLLRDRAGARRRRLPHARPAQRSPPRAAPAEPGVRGRGGDLRRARGDPRASRPDTAVRLWPWTLTPVLARTYAGIFLAFALGAALCGARARGRRRCGRSPGARSSSSAATAVVSLVHHAKFDGGPSTYVWAFGLAVGSPGAGSGGPRRAPPGAGMTSSLRAFLAVLGAALLAQGLMSWLLDASGNASNPMPYRFANADPRHALIHVVWGAADPRAAHPRPRSPGLRPSGARLRGLLHGPRGRSAWPSTIRSACGSTAARTSSTCLSARSRWPSDCVGAPRRTGLRVTAAFAVGAVLAGLAGVKALEGRLPRAIVRAGDPRVRLRAAGRAGLRHVGALAPVARAGRPGAARRALGRHRPRDIARLSPSADAPQLPDDAVDQGGLPCRRRDGRAEPAGRLGRAPPRAPRPLRSRGRPAQPHSTASSTPTSAGCSRSARPSASATAAGSSTDRIVMMVDRTALVWLALGLVAAGAGRRLARPPVGRHRPDRRPQPGDVRGELGLPRLRLPAVRDRRRKPQQPARRRRSRSARAGTTTTTPSPRWPTTAWAANPTPPGS